MNERLVSGLIYLMATSAMLAKPAYKVRRLNDDITRSGSQLAVQNLASELQIPTHPLFFE